MEKIRLTRGDCELVLKQMMRSLRAAISVTGILLAAGVALAIRNGAFLLLPFLLGAVGFLLFRMVVAERRLSSACVYLELDTVSAVGERKRFGNGQGRKRIEKLFYFEKNGRYSIVRSLRFPDVSAHLPKGEWRQAEDTTLDWFAAGAKFYLLIANRGKGKRILVPFCTYTYQLATDEFSEVEGCYIVRPAKIKSGENGRK